MGRRKPHLPRHVVQRRLIAPALGNKGDDAAHALVIGGRAVAAGYRPGGFDESVAQCVQHGTWTSERATLSGPAVRRHPDSCAAGGLRPDACAKASADAAPSSRGQASAMGAAGPLSRGGRSDQYPRLDVRQRAPERVRQALALRRRQVPRDHHPLAPGDQRQMLEPEFVVLLPVEAGPERIEAPFPRLAPPSDLPEQEFERRQLEPRTTGRCGNRSGRRHRAPEGRGRRTPRPAMPRGPRRECSPRPCRDSTEP